jgi:hypothetical protein
VMHTVPQPPITIDGVLYENYTHISINGVPVARERIEALAAPASGAEVALPPSDGLVDELIYEIAVYGQTGETAPTANMVRLLDCLRVALASREASRP